MFAFSRILVMRSLYQRIKGAKGDWPAPTTTAFPGIDIAKAAEAMRRDGIVQGLSLPQGVVDEIRAFTSTAPCFGNSNMNNRLQLSPGELPAESSDYIIADYRDGIGACPAIRQLWTDPVLLGIAGSYMGMKPHLLRSRLWWSLVSPETEKDIRADFSQEFHFDLDDWMCCKFFFYITETTERHGPHQFVRTSHRRRPLSLQLSLLKGQAEERVHHIYGPANVLTMTGPAGYGFGEDPFGIHRGTVPTAEARLILEIEYGSTAQQLVAGRYGVPPERPATQH